MVITIAAIGATKRVAPPNPFVHRMNFVARIAPASRGIGGVIANAIVIAAKMNAIAQCPNQKQNPNAARRNINAQTAIAFWYEREPSGSPATDMDEIINILTFISAEKLGVRWVYRL